MSDGVTPMEEADGLRRRKAAADTKHTEAMENLWEDAASKMTSSQVDAAWERLLAETLPPEKQETQIKFQNGDACAIDWSDGDGVFANSRRARG